jgi:succinate dehydrogenase / fumarate reductase, cytochrome b subunit
MATSKDRPISPHLTIWRWGPHMLVSILHRITGAGLSIVGLAALTWWLLAVAGSEQSYATFQKVASHWIGTIILIGLTWAFFQHLFSGLRHLVTDTGMGFELKSNKISAILTIIGSLLCTAVLWAYLMGVVK